MGWLSFSSVTMNPSPEIDNIMDNVIDISTTNIENNNTNETDIIDENDDDDAMNDADN